MGSTSDWDVMKHVAQQLKDFDVSYDARALSAHRSPDLLFTLPKDCYTKDVVSVPVGKRPVFIVNHPETLRRLFSEDRE